MQKYASDGAGIGHNIDGASIRVEVRFFNSLAKFTCSQTLAEKIEVAAGATIGDLIRRFNLPVPDIFLVLKNGRDITPCPYQGGVVNMEAILEDGDTICDLSYVDGEETRSTLKAFELNSIVARVAKQNGVIVEQQWLEA